jgi:hypothetical protein
MKLVSNKQAHVTRDGAQSVSFRQGCGLELRRRRTDSADDAHPITAIGKREREMQHDAPHGTFHPDTELGQAFTQCAHLSACALTASSAQAQLPHQLVGGGHQQHAHLVGHEGRAARKFNRKYVRGKTAVQACIVIIVSRRGGL